MNKSIIKTGKNKVTPQQGFEKIGFWKEFFSWLNGKTSLGIFPKRVIKRYYLLVIATLWNFFFSPMEGLYPVGGLTIWFVIVLLYFFDKRASAKRLGCPTENTKTKHFLFILIGLVVRYIFTILGLISADF